MWPTSLWTQPPNRLGLGNYPWLQVRQVQPRIVHLGDLASERRRPEAPTIQLLGPAGLPPAHGERRIAGHPALAQSIAPCVPQRVERLPVALGPDPVKPPIGPTLEVA